MKKKIRQRINQWICKHFGHKTVEEIYAVRCDKLWGFPESNSKRQNIFIGYSLTRDANVAELSIAV